MYPDRLANGLGESPVDKSRYAVSECANARQDEGVSFSKFLRRRGNECRSPDGMEGVVDRPEIADPAIDYGNHFLG